MFDSIDQEKGKLDKNKALILFSIYLLFWYLNYCTPLIFDDYIYSFIFSDYSMGVPLPDTAAKIDSFKDILVSQWNHYFSWGGRTVAHTLAQFFLWQGKFLFSFVNAACFLLLLLEICWIVNKGEISLNFSEQDIVCSFGLLWIFSIGLGDVFVWLTLACNYLWTTVILLGFLLAYEQHYFYGTLLLKNKAGIFLLGLITGWTNENTICFVIPGLMYYLISLHKKGSLLQQDYCLLYGLAGLCLGYLLLLLSPGNYVRFIRETQDGVFLSGLALWQRNINAIIKLLALRSFLYFYILKNLFFLKKQELDEQQLKLLSVSSIFVVFSLSSLLIMVISPEFRFRSSFPGLIFTIIAVGLIRNIVRIRKQSAFDHIKTNMIHVVRIMAFVYVGITIVGSIYVYSLQHQQTQTILSGIENEKNNPTGNVLVVKERPYSLNEYNKYNAMTGFHLVFPYSLVADENCWINKDVALYYSIKFLKTTVDEALQQ